MESAQFEIIQMQQTEFSIIISIIATATTTATTTTTDIPKQIQWQWIGECARCYSTIIIKKPNEIKKQEENE